jgi:hypothetical protein
VIGDLDQIVVRDRCDAKALASFERHKAFRDQLRQRLAQRADAETVAFGQVGEFQLGVRSERVPDDVVAQPRQQILATR